MRIRKFNESIDNNSVIDDDFADLKDISEIEYPSDESNVYTFSLVIDDHSYFNVDEMLDNNNKINHFIKTFKKCLKNSDLNIDYEFAYTKEAFEVEFIIDNKVKDILKITDKYIYVDLNRLTKELKNISNKIHSIAIVDRYDEAEDINESILQIYVLSGTTDDEYDKIESYFNFISNIVFDYEIEAKIIDNKKHDILEVMTYSYKSFKEF